MVVYQSYIFQPSQEEDSQTAHYKLLVLCLTTAHAAGVQQLFSHTWKGRKNGKSSLPPLQKYQTHSILVHCNVLAGSYHLEFLSLCLLREYLPTEITKVRIAGIRIIIWIPKIPSPTLLQIKDMHTGFCETLTGKKALRLRGEIFYSSECIYS